MRLSTPQFASAEPRITDIIARLDAVTEAANRPTALDPVEINMSMGESVKERVKRSHAELFDHALNELDNTIRLLQVMRDGLVVKHEEANQKTDEFCAYINDILLKNSAITDSARQLGKAVLDNRVA